MHNIDYVERIKEQVVIIGCEDTLEAERDGWCEDLCGTVAVVVYADSQP